MSDRFKRVLTASTAVHIALVLVLLVVPIVARLLTPKKTKEVVVFLNIVEPTPQLPVPDVPSPEPPQPPEPRKDDIPPVKKDPAPKPPEKREKPPIKRSTNLVRRAQSPPVAKKPPLTEEQIRRLLALGPAAPSAVAASADPTALDWYYALVKAEMYRVWIQPGDLSQSAGLVTRTSIRVGQDGRVTDRRILRRSGNPVMDASVQQALDRVTRLDRLPDEVRTPSLEITIDFELTGGLPGVF